MRIQLARNELKGFAIIWIILSHTRFGLTGVFNEFIKIGYGGVDLFFFLTGFGLYYSLEKSNDLLGYTKRRILRLFPSYLPFCLLWLCIMLPLFQTNLVDSIKIIIGNLSMLGYFADAPQIINWYVSALILFLLIAPFVIAFLQKSQKPLITLAYLLILSFAIGICFIDSHKYIVFSRLPVFLLGMGFALPFKKLISYKIIYSLSFLSLIVGITLLFFCLNRFTSQQLISTALYWHPFVLIAPSFCLLFSGFVKITPFLKCIWQPLSFIGTASFEIFLFNVWFEKLGKSYNLASKPLDWIFLSIGSILLGIGYHMAINFFTKKRKSA